MNNLPPIVSDMIDRLLSEKEMPHVRENIRLNLQSIYENVSLALETYDNRNKPKLPYSKKAKK